MPIITISRGSLSGGQQLATAIADRLGFTVLSREVVVAAAEKYGVSEEELTEYLDQPAGLWERLTHHKERYILAMQAALAQMAADGHCIYHGHVGQFLLKGLPGVLKVRLIAPVDQRVGVAMSKLSCSREHAVRHLQAIDDRRVKWVRRLYGADLHDSSLYDVVINLEHMRFDTAVDLIVELVTRKEYSATEETRRELRDFALATLIRAELAFRSPFSEEVVEIAVHGGVVHLSGGPAFLSRRSEIVQFVRDIEGVDAVTPDVDRERVITTADQRAEVASAEKRARDVMLPPDRYPGVEQWMTIRDTIVALSGSTVRFEDGHIIQPRYVLIYDENNRIVGVTGRRNLVRGLTPQHRHARRTKRQVHTLAAYGGSRIELDIDWASLFNRAAAEASLEPVSTIMAPIRAFVDVDDPLSAVVTTMIQNEVDLVPVLDDSAVAGVILMTDMFDVVAQFILESTAPPGGRS